jgi:hypothetical protein
VLVPVTRWQLSIALMMLGAAVAVSSVIVGAVQTKNDLRIEADHSAPALLQVHLPAGNWEVYEQTATVSRAGAGPLSFSYQSGRSLDIDAADIRVADPRGRPVALHQAFGASSFQTYSTGSRIYTGVASFRAGLAGTYAIEVRTPTSDQVIIAHPPLDGLRRSLGWIIGAVAGGVVLVTGIVLFILEVDRRRRAKYPPPPAAGVGPWGRPQWGPPPWPPGPPPG